MPSRSAIKLLFVCSRNRRRSLTAERLFDDSSLYQARSAGTQAEARIAVTAGHLRWADIIFCMERSHLNKLRLKYPEALEGRRIICLNIPDEYEYMDEHLVDDLRAALGEHLSLE